MTTDLDLLDLRVVRAIADTGSFTAAAALLGYSQPAVTQRLRRAEAQLGQPLVLRSGRGITLTEAGRRLAQHAVHVQAAFDAARQELDDLGGATTGTLRLAGFPSASPTLVPSVIATLRQRHPGLTVTYVEAEPPEAIALVREGAVDLAFTFSYPGDGLADSEATEGLRITPLYRDTTLVVAPEGLLDAPTDAGHESEGAPDPAAASPRPDSLASPDPAPLDLGALAGARFIGGCPRCRGHLLATCRSAGFEPDIVLETDNAQAVAQLVAAGLGVALLPGLALSAGVVPSGVEVRALPEAGDRVVQLAHSVGAERVPAVMAGLAAVSTIDALAYGLRRVEPARAG